MVRQRILSHGHGLSKDVIVEAKRIRTGLGGSTPQLHHKDI